MGRLHYRPHITALIQLLGLLALLAPQATLRAQTAARVAAAEKGSNIAGEMLAQLKPSRQLTSKPKPAPRKPAVQPPRPAGTPVPPLVAGDLPKRSAAELVELIEAQRNALKAGAPEEGVRRNLGMISIEAANRILRAEAFGLGQEATAYINLVKSSLADTFWRVTQLVRNEPARAQAALGLYYAEGILVAADPARSCENFAKAADAGHTDAAFKAAQCMAKTEPQRAQQWLEQAAIGGNPAAEEKMGRACIERPVVDTECAKRWLQSAAAQGRISAISVLAWLYVREGTPESLSEASKLYQTAADAGDFAAQNNLGEFFETGRGVKQDPSQALGWYRKSAERGFAPAQYNLARLLAFGAGTPRDPPAAREWATKAQAQGVAQATELLKLIADAEKTTLK